MPQGPLPFKIEEEHGPSGATALAGLPAYLDLAKVLGLAELVREHVNARRNKQGWMDAQIVMALVLLQERRPLRPGVRPGQRRGRRRAVGIPEVHR